MKIKRATREYEGWLGTALATVDAKLVEKDLALKHERMAKSLFEFFRATFYRWAERFVTMCPVLCGEAVPRVLGVGDLHVENFGTWRDAEGRLVWGLNDFDECASMPYTVDLVRLAASAEVASRGSGLGLKHGDACEAILAGYVAALNDGGRPFVLGEKHVWLREIAESKLREPIKFWAKLDGNKPPETPIPERARGVLSGSWPEPHLFANTGGLHILHRIAGLGSLGRPRYLALGDWRGGRIAREVKPLVPSAWRFADLSRDEDVHYAEVLTRAVRAPDPFAAAREGWVARRLSPHCSRIELAMLPDERDEAKLLHAMGYETANVHLASPDARRAILADLDTRPSHFLHAASSRMLKSVEEDFADWRSSSGD